MLTIVEEVTVAVDTADMLDVKIAVAHVFCIITDVKSRCEGNRVRVWFALVRVIVSLRMLISSTLNVMNVRIADFNILTVSLNIDTVGTS